MTTELTQLHGILIDALNELEVSHVDEYSIWAVGHCYSLDCFLPDYYAFIEADGPHHKMRTKKDQDREQNLLTLGLRSLHLPHTYLTRAPQSEIVSLIARFIATIAPTVAARRNEKGRDAFGDFTDG